MDITKDLVLVISLLTLFSMAYANEPPDIGSTKETPQTDRTTIKSTVNYDGIVTVKYIGTDGEVVSSSAVTLGGGANVYDPNGDFMKDPAKVF